MLANSAGISQRTGKLENELFRQAGDDRFFQNSSTPH